MIRHVLLAIWVSFATVFILLWSISSMAIEVSSEPQLEISKLISWCATDTSTSIESIADGGCAFRTATLTDLAAGFSKQAFWLRINLHNPEPHEIERWLRVGHSRLQKVSLFEKDQIDIWHHIDTGLSVPRALRPVVDANQILPLQLKAYEEKTVYVRVESATPIGLSLTLWKKEAYVAARHKVELLQVLSFGGLIAVAFFSLMVYFTWHDRVYLYFGATLFSEILLDCAYTGLMQTYLWPDNRPFNLSILVLSTALMAFFLAMFIREFVGDISRYQRYYLVLMLSYCVLLLSSLWASFVNYNDSVQLVYLAVFAMLLTSFALFFRSWRNGSRPSGYLMVASFMILLSFIYRMIVAYGGLGFASIQHIEYTWGFLLVTPAMLAAIHLRSAKLQNTTRQVNARVQFLAQMSHELRSPLNTILGYADLMQRNSLRCSVQEGTTMIKHSGRYLLDMIDEILDHARNEAGVLMLSYSPVHWESFVEKLKKSTEMMVRPRGNRFELIQVGDMPQELMLDERRLRQVLDILLSNANRYTQHGDISLRCAASTTKGNRSQMTFSVIDTGAGISPEDFDLIFQPFMRGLAGKSSGIDGSGMGLTIAQQLVMLMNGKIYVNSLLGVGSQFKFSIECERVESWAMPSLTPLQGLLTNQCTALVVDDDQVNCRLLAMQLSDRGFSVITASSGNDARQFLDTKVDIIITDQFMPNGDGWSVLQDWNSSQIPVILLSAAPPQRPDDFPSALNFTSIQLKPLNTDSLLASIAMAFPLEWDAVKEESHQDVALHPPMELLSPLMEMIEDGAVTDITEWLKLFAYRYPEYSAYSAKIAACNLMLDFAGLRELIGAGVPPNQATGSPKPSL